MLATGREVVETSRHQYAYEIGATNELSILRKKIMS